MGEKYSAWRTPDGLVLLEGWARDGLSDGQIAERCGCKPQTLLKWKERFPEIRKALEKGRDIVDYEVENAFLKRALGYDYTETRTESGREDKQVQTEKHMPPSVRAAELWLRKRRPEKWGDGTAAGDEGNQTGCIELPEVPEDG